MAQFSMLKISDDKAMTLGGTHGSIGVTALYKIECKEDDSNHAECQVMEMEAKLRYPRKNGAAILVSESYC